jgi:hypothetical protein
LSRYNWVQSIWKPDSAYERGHVRGKVTHDRISGGVFHDQIMMANMMERRSKTDPVAPGQSTAIVFLAGTAATTPVDFDLYADFNGVPGRYGRVCG